MTRSKKDILQAIRNMKRRKGGIRRARFEATLMVAEDMAKWDCYIMEPGEYIELAEQSMAACRNMTLTEWHANNRRWEREEAKARRKLRVIQGGKD